MIGPRAAIAALAFAALVAVALGARGVVADDLYDEARESFQCDAPKVLLVRPDASWQFVRVDVQKSIAVAARPDAQRDFDGLIARLHHPPTRATVSVYAFPLQGAAPDLARLEAHALEDVKRRKDWRLAAEQARGAVGGREVVKTDYYAALETPQGGMPAGTIYYYSRIDAVDASGGHALVILFEAPRERLKAALSGWQKILKKLKLA
jgi:hypothetical protein